MSRTAFGKEILKLGGNLERVADARVAIDQARLLTLYAAYKMDTLGNMAALTEISAIKVVAPSVLEKVVDMAIQLHGGAGVSRDTPLTGFFAQARSLRLADGPDEVHKGMIAKLELVNVVMVVIKSISLKEVNMSVIDVGGEVRDGEELDIGAVENWLKPRC